MGEESKSKLALNKTTIANLKGKDMNLVYGGLITDPCESRRPKYCEVSFNQRECQSDPGIWCNPDPTTPGYTCG